MQKVNIKKAKLKNLKKYNFGEYLQLVEECIFNSESLLERKNKELHEIKKKSIKEVGLFLMALVSFIFCPIILIALAANDKSMLEALLYSVWLVGGVLYFKKHFKSFNSNRKLRQESKKDIGFAVDAALNYTKSVCDAFFNKQEEIKHGLKHYSEADLNRLKKWVLHLEIDFLLMEEMVYKHQKLNESPIIIDPSEYQKGREFSHQYLGKYLVAEISQNNKIR